MSVHVHIVPAPDREHRCWGFCREICMVCGLVRLYREGKPVPFQHAPLQPIAPPYPAQPTR